jgi:serine/threonine protein kinase
MNPAPALPPAISGHTYLRPIGTGRHADVYLYRQERSRREVAVKVLRRIRVDGEEWGRFTDQAAAMPWWAGHSDVVPILATGVTGDGRGYLTMPYYPGPDLGTVVATGPLLVSEVLAVGSAIAEAVHAAHRAGIVHGDVKPANILTDAAGIPRLTDFGLVGSLLPVSGEDVSAVSVPWSAPEVLGGGKVTVEADVYALGATLWHLLMGRAPFEVVGGDNRPAAVRRRVMSLPAPEVSRADAPEALVFLLSQMVLGDPAQRPASADIVADTLSRIRRRVDLRLDPTARPRPNMAPGSGRPQASSTQDAGEEPGHTRRPARNRGIGWGWPPRRRGR